MFEIIIQKFTENKLNYKLNDFKTFLKLIQFYKKFFKSFNIFNFI